MIRTRRTARRGVAAPALVLGLAAPLAGCGAGMEPAAPEPSGSLGCQGTPIPVAALTDPRPATELDADARAALRGQEVPEVDPAEWVVVSAGPAEVVLLRELPEPADLGAGDVRTHERLVIGVVDAPNVPGSPAWQMTALGTCALAADVPGAGTATVTLDPARPPDPTLTEVPLLVTERACNSGQDATGRVDVAALRQTDAVVEVVITVRPRGGGQDCPSNPPTPFTLQLDAPLGDRQPVDGSVVPPRPLVMPTE